MNDKETECAERLTAAILPIVKEIGIEGTARLLATISARFLETVAKPADDKQPVH
jgi:hypothetical protein